MYTDRFAARVVFDEKNAAERGGMRALSSQRDFMADPTEQILRKIGEERAK